MVSVVKKNYRIGDLFVGGFWGANAALLFYALKWYNCVVMKMAVPKNLITSKERRGVK